MRISQPRIEQTGVIVKAPHEIDLMREAGRVVAGTHKLLKKELRPGITTGYLDDLAYEYINGQGATPSFLGYRGYPKTICTSVNEEIVHGIPGKRVLNEGDIVGIDIGAIVEGFHGDSAFTWPVGDVEKSHLDLLDAGEGSLHAAFPYCTPAYRIGDLSWAVQQYAESRGFSVVREYVGHGIGRTLHEEPSVPNYGSPGKGLPLRPGMVLAIEPMVNVGTWRTRLLDDNWTVITEDGQHSVHFEHTLAITEGEPEILTAWE